jgi:hypothetical protein
LIQPPCIYDVYKDGVNSSGNFGVFITTDPYTQVSGVLLQGINVAAGDTATVTFAIAGSLNESSIPVIFGANGQDPNSENRACLIGSVRGPACVDCKNPFGVQSLRTLQMWQPTSHNG